MHLVLDGFEGRADNAVHKVQLLKGVFRHIQQLYFIVCFTGSNPVFADIRKIAKWIRHLTYNQETVNT